MAEKVGSIHQHVLPSAYDVKLHEVYACHCGKEFYRGQSEGHKNPEWGPVDDTGLPVLYDKTVGGKEFIGRATADTIFDEEPVDQLAEGAQDESKGTSGESDRPGAVSESRNSESGESATAE